MHVYQPVVAINKNVTHTAFYSARGIINWPDASLLGFKRKLSSRNFVEVRWRSCFRSTSLGKRCTSYNAPPNSPKRAADRWSLRNFLSRSSFFVVEKAQKSHGARSGLYGGCSNGVPPIHFSKPNTEFNSVLVPNPAIGHDSEPVPSTSHPHNLCP
jgi:hypothetical protein